MKKTATLKFCFRSVVLHHKLKDKTWLGVIMSVIADFTETTCKMRVDSTTTWSTSLSQLKLVARQEVRRSSNLLRPKQNGSQSTRTNHDPRSGTPSHLQVTSSNYISNPGRPL